MFGSSDFPLSDSSRGLVRLSQDGIQDMAFRPIVQLNGPIRQVVPLENEQLLLLGSFSRLNYLSAPRVAGISLVAPGESGAILFFDSDVSRILIEGDEEDSLAIPIRRFGPTTSTEAVSIEILGGTATIGRDFTLSEKSLIFGPHEVEKEITLRVLDDGLLEAEETVDLVLRGALSTGPNTQITVILRDNEVSNALDYSFKARVGSEIVPRVMEIAADGSIYVGGSRDSSFGRTVDSIIRLRPDGSLDEAFQLSFDLAGIVSSISVLPNHIYVSGYFSSFGEGGVQGEHLARLHLDGSLDTSFETGTGLDRPASTMLPMADGSLLVGGGFSRFNNRQVGRLIKLLSDGTLDLGFRVELGSNASIHSLGQQRDGSIIVSGLFFGLPGRDFVSLIRLHSDGSLDSEWEPMLIGTVSQVQVATDDTIYISGNFKSVEGRALPGLARLQAGGRLDQDFVPDERILSINKMRLKEDGMLIVSGGFDQAGGMPAMLSLDSEGRIRDDFNSLLGMPRVPRVNQNFVIDREGRLIVSGYTLDEEQMVFSSIVRLSESAASGATIGFLRSNHQVLESSGRLEVELNRIGDVDDLSRVLWRARGVSGGANTNQWDQEGVAIFRAKERRHPIHLEIQDDVLAESDEQVVIDLEALSRGDMIGFSDLKVRILDNDRAGSLDESFVTDIRRIDQRFIRWNGNGLSSLSINSNLGFSFGVGDVNQIFNRRGDQILIRGDFDLINDQEVENIALLNSDGSVDAEFKPELSAISLRWIEVQSSEKIVVLGRELDGRILFRMNRDGTLDEGFSSVFSDDVEAISGFRLLSDDRILLWGSFHSFRAEDRAGLLLLSADGEADPSFHTGILPRTALTDVAILPDDRILISGSIRHEGFNRPLFLAQLTAEGSLDPAFDVSAGPNRRVSSITPIDAEHIYIEGEFTHVGSEPQRHQGWVDSHGRPTEPVVAVEGSPNYRNVHHQQGKRLYLPGRYRHDGKSIPGLGVFEADGSADSTFNFGEGVEGLSLIHI